MERTHYKRLSQIVQVLTHCHNRIPFPPSTVIDHTAFHPRAERTNRVLLHAFTCPVDQSVTLNPIWHSNLLHVRDKWLRFVLEDHWVNSHSTDVKFDRSHGLKVLQNMDQSETVLASRQSYKNTITVFDHTEVPDGRSHLFLNG